jgi:predicted secreted protein
MKHASRNVRLFLLCLPLLFGCDIGEALKSAPQLDASANGTTLTYVVNQSFSLELDLNADAGYLWYYTISDTTVVRLDSTRYRPKSGSWNQEGGFTVATFYFRVTQTGNCSIDLAERRGWLPNEAPRNTLRFTVVVYH